jgi:hypothetical protein
MKTIKDADIMFGLITDGSEQIMYESYEELMEHVPDAKAINLDNDDYDVLGYVADKDYEDGYKEYIIVTQSDTFKIVKNSL